jgi:hypothetical protein
METINVDGLPKPIIRALEIVAEMARKLTGKKSPAPQCDRVKLGVRKGTVYGTLTREEIYDDVA